jgi:hypothetical protein
MKTLTRNTIALKKLNALIIPQDLLGQNDSRELAMAFQANVMRLGFILSENLVDIISTLSVDSIGRLYPSVINTLKEMKGADVEHRPMYPNFPRQVMEASDVELFVNAIAHYWTLGEWKPDYEKLPRKFSFEETKFLPIRVASGNEFRDILHDILSSADSITEEDKQIVQAFLENEENPRIPDEIPFKENMCLVAGYYLSKGKPNPAKKLMKTATDVLRVATYMSGGDVSLAENTKFISFPRSTRRVFVEVLERVGREEDFIRHKNKWVRLFHCLHIGEFKGRIRETAAKLRNNEKIVTFNGRLESRLARKNVVGAVDMLMERPGEFARRLDHLLRLSPEFDDATYVTQKFVSVVGDIPTRNLLQLMGHLRVRNHLTKRVVFPKGSAQRAQTIPGHNQLYRIDERLIARIGDAIQGELIRRFGDLKPLGRMWVDPELQGCPLPTQMRSASEGLLTVARGSQLPIDDDGVKKVLRLFIYWVGLDVDLSATFHNEAFETVSQISYTNLRCGELRAWHSGDITRAPCPHGASEFIDIDIDGAIRAGVRYVTMNVFSFSGIPFSDMETCFAGWMTRNEPESNEIYDPMYVKQKIDLRTPSRNAVPVVFDLHYRKAIWVDLTTRTRTHHWGNNVHSNRATIEDIVEAMTTLSNKVSLYDLLVLHAIARGDLVNAKSDADIVFGFDRDEGYTPYDVTFINSELIV